MKITSWVKTIFDSLYDGILIVNTAEIVIYINPAYTRITGVEASQILNKRLRDVRKGSRLHKVLETGKPIVGALRQENGTTYSVNMSPIIEDSDLIGGISVVSTIDDTYNLYQHIEKYELKVKNLERRIRTIQGAKYKLEDIIHNDINSLALINVIKKIAPRDTNVLIYGESGTGKELYANTIHNESQRKDEAFIAVNCAAFQGDLLESELFGYEGGAFTGAKVEGKMGLFEAASNGTIFLDEISEMNLDLQAKLLRTLQENTIRRVGSVKELTIDVRVIAATNKNLEDLVEQGLFRQDLFYRISVFPLTIPPLRERKADIIPLVDHFLSKYKNELKKDIVVDTQAEEMLLSYSWPGNVRELRNAVEFAVNMMDDNIIIPEHLPRRIQDSAAKAVFKIKKLEQIIKETEQNEINKVLRIYGNTVEGKKKAAKLLGISLASLYNKIKE